LLHLINNPSAILIRGENPIPELYELSFAFNFFHTVYRLDLQFFERRTYHTFCILVYTFYMVHIGGGVDEER
jgi:hypothetical protein